MSKIQTPDELLGELFVAVQSRSIFSDSKTFVDATPLTPPKSVLEAFARERQAEGFDLAAFVKRNFELPRSTGPTVEADRRRPVREHIELVWGALQNDADRPRAHSSLIALPCPYVVPGGRFREVYYWDSYFSQLGLVASDRTELAESTVRNFAYLIDQLGFVPNANRTYYATRSQPPMFAVMVEQLATATGDDSVLVRFLPHIKKEHAFWMAGADQIDERQAVRRVLRFRDGLLNRYWDASSEPRPESYREDIELSGRAGRPSSELYRDLRAACESGWDFSSRWLHHRNDLGSACTRHVVPVDLNAMLCALESTIAKSARLTNDTPTETAFRGLADARTDLMQRLFFDEEQGGFVDLTWPGLEPRPTLSMAMTCPLFFGLATKNQANRVADTLRGRFLKAGGWVTTTARSGQQWDAPNGWAPLQWFAYEGLRRYGFHDDAREGARRWVDNNLAVYEQTGLLAEKYDVETVGVRASGGEYEVQIGFGWTNGILLRFLNELGL